MTTIYTGFGGSFRAVTQAAGRSVRASLALSLVAVAMFGSGCTVVEGNGVLAQETRQGPSFLEIEAGDDVVVVVSVDPTLERSSNLEISGDENLLAYVETRRVGQTLVVSQAPGIWLWPSTPLRVDVRVPELRGVDVHGAARVTVRDFDQRRLRVRAFGSSTVRLTGIVDNLSVQMGDDAELDAGGLLTWSSRVDASGQADAHVCVEDTLDVLAVEESMVAYSCAPFTVYESSSESARVAQRF